MTWDHRIFKDANGFFALHEVYYDEKGRTRGWAERPDARYLSVDELIDALKQMLNDAKRCKDDVLDFNSEPENPFVRPAKKPRSLTRKPRRKSVRKTAF